ncbi:MULTISPECIES: hypothetical protein [Halomonadaceae]|uniref:Uncharacterized protein n=1 Tax=Vreelandella titanicae TaxID=664683 RepID=A0AAP9NLR3_9GAMM|nr:MULTISPECIES: hypothetical protein [Halomonas]QKS24407.1 hypothetical protein FX987_02184 [Halomonas titanicae]CDG54341.1 hypothetical protein HALA3H3_720041 [Halomonas sp. A3H3]SDJ36585.1 hypothetical protein SAMN04487867_1372 [Halomonas titanicae]|tara:strand:- start:586 stop:1842 length:1257 start_codon:yes stop_codon:yes gene_type:complete
MEEERSYSLPLKALPSLEYSYHLQDLIELNEYLSSKGLRSRNTRIERYIEYFSLVLEKNEDPWKVFKNSLKGPFESPLDWELYILREVHELMWILRGMKCKEPLGGVEKLELMIGGSDFAALDKDSSSRNAQFELRIASYFLQCGCHVDLTTETDVIAISNKEVFYIECKRVSSRKQLAKRIRDAEVQLQKRMPLKHDGKKVFGCVAADVTKVAYQHNGLTFAVTSDHARDTIQKDLQDVVSHLEAKPDFGTKKRIFNYWFQIHIPSLVAHPPSVATRFSSFHKFNERSNRKEVRAAKNFCEIFESASLISDKRENPPQQLKPQTEYRIPAGATYSFDKDVVCSVLREKEGKEWPLDKELAVLEIKNDVHYFYVADSIIAMPIIEKTIHKSGYEELEELALIMIAIMFAQRFPYEQSV